MSAASGLRDEVVAGGGRLEITVRELRNAFGFTRLTAAARMQIADELATLDLLLQPPLGGLRLDDRVAVVDVRPAPVPGPRRPSSGNRRRAVIAGAAVGLLVVLAAAVFGSRAGRGPDAPPAARPPAVTVTTPTSTTSTTATQPPPAQSRAEVLARLARIEAAVARDDPAAARDVLLSIAPESLEGHPDLRERVRIARHRVGVTAGYIEAARLGDSGHYRVARARMLALVPFRDAGVRARQYGVQAAKNLVDLARSVSRSRPAWARSLLVQAQALAPNLSEIAQVRAQLPIR